MSETDLHDVVIVGAGPGGSALAMQLAGHGLRTLLLDRREFPRDKTCGDALSPTAVRLLRRLGAPAELWKLGHRVDRLYVSSPGGAEIRMPLSPELDPSGAGYVIRRFDLDDQLRRLAVDAGAEFRGEVHVTEIREGPSLEVVDSKSQAFRAHVVILAVGASLRLLRSLDLVPGRLDIAYAARLYFRDLPAQPHELRLHFDGVPLPGYGWVFPASSDSANVGAGLFGGSDRHSQSAYRVLERWLRHPPIADLLAGSHADGPMKAYPLRTDFHRSPVRRGRLLLIGEAAGLVNPFTGEGIDYALESAVIAAESVIACFDTGDFSEPTLDRYEIQLRARFQRIFTVTNLMRRLYMNRRILDALVRAANRRPAIARLFVDILLGGEQPLKAFAPGVLLQILRSLPQAS